MPDEYAFLREPAERPGPEPEGSPARGGRRRRNVAFVGLGVALAVAVVATAAVRLPNGDRPTADVTILPTAPPTTARLIVQSPVPPPRGAPFPDGAGASVLRHSGGPYLSRAHVVAMVLAQLECKLGTARRNMPGFACARVDVAFFERYADAWKLRGASWALVHTWGADREMYVVTVWGHLDSASARLGARPELTEITTVLIDATTGRTMMEGGPPLPAADANR